MYRIKGGENVSNDRLRMFEELAKAKGPLEGALVLELIDWIRKQLRLVMEGNKA